MINKSAASRKWRNSPRHVLPPEKIGSTNQPRESPLNFISEQLFRPTGRSRDLWVDSRQCHTRTRLSCKILKRHCVPGVESQATDASAGTSVSIDLERSRDGLSRLRCRLKVDVPGQTRLSWNSPCPAISLPSQRYSRTPTQGMPTVRFGESSDN